MKAWFESGHEVCEVSVFVTCTDPLAGHASEWEMGNYAIKCACMNARACVTGEREREGGSIAKACARES